MSAVDETPEDTDPGVAPIGDHVIVCGLKGVGLRVVELLAGGDVPVTVLDLDPTQVHRQMVESWGATYLHQPGHLKHGLDRAGLADALAVICAETDELAALEIALSVRERRSDVRLVVQMENTPVRKALEAVIAPGAVLDAAALTAPSFVEVCLREEAHVLELAGERFDVVQTTIGPEDRPATFRTFFSSLSPVAIVSGDGSEMERCPGRDHPVRAGDRVALLGTPEALRDAGLSDDDRSKATAHPTTRSIWLRRSIAAVRDERSRGVVVVLAMIVGLIALATTVVRLGYQPAGGHEHLSVLQSLYFVVETVATVGFGDYSYANQSAWLQAFGIALIIVGVVLTTTTIVLLTNLLVGRRIDQSLGRREVPGMAGHVIVVGLGSIGIGVVEGLVAQGSPVVVVERDDNNRYLSRVRAMGVPVIIADATQRQTLSMVNLAKASAVVVLTSEDLTNIEAALAIRESLGDDLETTPVVLRVTDPSLARLMEQSFGFRYVRSTAALAAPFFIAGALGLDVIATFFIDRQPFLVGRLRIAPGGGLQGRAMGDLSVRTRVVGIRRSEGKGIFEHPPRRGTRFEGGDDAFVLGPDEEILRLLREDQASRS